MSETLLVNGEEIPMPHDLREIIDSALSPVKESLHELNNDVKNISVELQQMKTFDALQEREIELLKEKQKTQEERITLLERHLGMLEDSVNMRLHNLSQAPTEEKAKKFDTIIKTIGSVVVSVVTTALLVLLGIDKLKG